MAGQAGPPAGAGDGHAAGPPLPQKDAKAAAAAAKKAARKKAAKAAKRDVAAARAAQAAADAARAERAAGFTVAAAAVDYVPEEVGAEAMDAAAGPGAAAGDAAGASSAMADLQRVFAKFAGAGEEAGGGAAAAAAPGAKAAAAGSDDEAGGEDDDDEEADDAYGAPAAAADGETKKSRRARKADAASRVAALKRACPRPDVVEAWDTTAPDPELLVCLKAARNAVPVPRHWSQKRAYLAGKRGLERPPFELPAFIAATGVGEMRAAYADKEAAASLKSAARARVRPKAGKLDLDYQVLHDAFFVHQTKPPLSGYGQVYYEGKEFEADPPLVTPGRLSEELREALGMPPADPRAPPPWLVSMQRWGPPPSYPRLAVPGLSAPLPPGGTYGYQAGGWGKPPVDEAGRPLYGDAFGDGVWAGAPGGGGGGQAAAAAADEPVDKAARWGELAPDEEEEEEEEEGGEGVEAVEPMAEDEDAAGTATGLASGAATLAGAGLETPASLDLRKGTASTLPGAAAAVAPPPPADAGPRPLYTVLEQRAAPLGAPGSALLGSDHTYVMPSSTPAAAAAAAGPGGVPAAAAATGKRGKAAAGGAAGGGGGGTGTAVALDPSALEGLDEAGVAALAAARAAAADGAEGGGGRADFSDLVAAQAVAAKRKAAARADAKAAKAKEKDFKF